MKQLFQAKIISLGFFGIMAVGCNSEKPTLPKKPNIIYIFTDQQSAKMMSCAGNKWVDTPAMDYIAQNGIRFTRAYATHPVCSPSRVSLITGRFPGDFNDDKGNPVKENVGSMRIPEISEEVKNTTIASFLKQAGYNLVYGGKEHLPKPLAPASLGFTVITNDERDELAAEAAKFIKSKPQEPYFMVVSLINPHDICYMAIRDFAETEHENRLLEKGQTELATLDKALKIPEGVSEDDFYDNYCPPLPPNFEPQEDEPEAITWMINQRNFQKSARENYTEKDWRRHRWAYCRLTEVVDKQIQTVLDALKESGQEENTLVLFSSDHGDMDASHRLEHKSILYEESANIPFMAMWKGYLPAARVDSVHLVSNGLDLLPTVCDFAGIAGKSDPRGKSLRPLFEGKKIEWRKNLGVESEVGKMVVDSEGYKYIRYDVEGIEENLLDLNKDPYEKTHFTNDPEHSGKLNELRKAFDEVWFPAK
jgi:arylsulfatase A-like enzyme